MKVLSIRVGIKLCRLKGLERFDLRMIQGDNLFK